MLFRSEKRQNSGNRKTCKIEDAKKSPNLDVSCIFRKARKFGKSENVQNRGSEKIAKFGCVMHKPGSEYIYETWISLAHSVRTSAHSRGWHPERARGRALFWSARRVVIGAAQRWCGCLLVHGRARPVRASSAESRRSSSAGLAYTSANAVRYTGGSHSICGSIF